MAPQSGDKHLVIAFFDNPVAAEVVARMLANDPGISDTPGTVGLLALDEDGKVAVAKLGPRTTDGAIGVGAVLGIIASALSGGVMPRRSYFFDAGYDLSTDDIARLGAELEAGQAAVAVLDERPQTDRAVVWLTRLGGKTEVHCLTGWALRLAATAPTIDP